LSDLFEYTAIYIEVLLPLPLAKEYTYRVPQELNDEIDVGKRVVVQFGKKKIYSGVILSISERPPEGYQAKYILAIIDSFPIISDKMLSFWRWIAEYYMCKLGEVMNNALPAALKLQSQSKINLYPDANTADVLLDKFEEPIIEKLKLVGSISIDEADEISGRKNTYKLIHSLYEKGLIYIEEELLERYKPKVKKFLKRSEAFSTEQAMQELFTSLDGKATLQLHVLMKLVSLDKNNEGVDKNKFVKKHGLSPSSVSTLVKNGVLDLYEKQVERIVYKGRQELAENELTNDQEEAYDQIKTNFEEQDVVLLQGITSSGKTHVYIKLMEEALALNKQVLYLLPEISLTTQLIRRIQTYFGDQVLVNHSRFNNNERYEIWQKVKNREATIVLAPRSGIFLPFQELGLIIVDEEHENSYKQSEPSPRYHARDSAIVLAHKHKAKVVLGSATPSVESMNNVRNEKFGLVLLKNRYSGVKLPEFRVVDMRQEKKRKLNKGLFSSELISEIKQSLNQKEQVILFQNRKGYVPITECNECAWSPRCIHCDITLTYYRKENCLRCHFCGYNIKPISLCPACGNTAMRMIGYGTERVEEELKLIVPEARIDRLDYQSTRTKTAFEKIITDFENRDTDVLIGTQMITKGLDFENLRLVGILDADHSLNFPDFRAAERSFQLFTQVAGRAGRRNNQGLVMIQTSRPENPVIQHVVKHEYNDFFEEEIQEREKFNYPPFARLIKMSLMHKDYELTEKAGDMMAMLIREKVGDMLLGPEEPYVSKIRGRFIRQMMIKITPDQNLKAVKHFVGDMVFQFKGIKEYKQVRVVVDVDP
jgi:primosomal protein N' (replication factor Y)